MVASQAAPSCHEPCTKTKFSTPDTPEGFARPLKNQALRAGFAHTQRLKDNGHACRYGRTMRARKFVPCAVAAAKFGFAAGLGLELRTRTWRRTGAAAG